jgi:2-dehydro-3-deoxyphosphogluconate aldolase/(4S)-4-hydroxy-2-oxoglutarate aldolase
MNFPSEEIYQKIQQYPIIPLFNHPKLEYTQNVLKACYEGGIRVFEYTNRGENPVAIFKELVPFVRANYPDMALGIGTIFTLQDAAQFADLGADFIIQPIANQAVAEFCQQKNMVWIPGVATLTEIYQATVWGAQLVKIFPGNVLGTEFVKALRGPMPHVQIMITGGVKPTIENLKEWFDAGANAVGIGSQLIKPSENIDYQSLTTKIYSLMQFAQSLKNGK